VARLLIVGGGCRGLRLAEEAGRSGHAVRIVTRAEDRRAQIEATGAECWIGDPNRLGTLRGVLDGVTIACWLLGGAIGPEEQLRALHSERLRAFLESAIDSTVRGLLYEGAGSSMPAGALAEGERIAREIAQRNSIPLAILDADPADISLWLEQTRGALAEMLTP
jgi:putative NADH-flavin reductase